MKNKLGYLGATVLILFSTNAFAAGGLFLEPAVTYQSGETTVSYPAPFDDSIEKVRGMGLGLRLGAHAFDTLFLALDGRYARPTYESSALDGRADATATNWGATLGVQTPLAGLRVWGTYIFDGELNPERINNADVKFTDFKGYRVGAGLYFAIVSVNFEYQEGKYGTTHLEDAGAFTGSTDDVTGKDKSYIVSLSFPIAL